MSSEPDETKADTLHQQETQAPAQARDDEETRDVAGGPRSDPDSRLDSAFDDLFQVLGVLGRGGMGVVYRARERELGREVALKVIRRRGSEDHLARFRREGEIAASLRHPGIVGIHSAGVVANQPYLSCELVEDARPLDEVLSQVELRRRVELIRDAARALGHAHRQGVVHRDVKPANILVDGRDRVRVTDFGLALGLDSERLTRSGVLVGTPSYMAPEQLHGRREEYGPPTDVWALGVLLFEALTGTHPFEGHRGGVMQLLAHISRGSIPRARDVADVPPDLDRICKRAIVRNPRHRYRDGEALARDLDAWLEGRPLKSGTAPVWQLVAGLVLLAGLVVGVAIATGGAPEVEPDPPRTETRDDERDAQAGRDLETIAVEPDPRQRVQRVEAWSRSNPDHPLAARAEEIRREARLWFPFHVLAQRSNGQVEAVFLGSSRLLVAARYPGRKVELWRVDSDRASLERSWDLPGGVNLLAADPHGDGFLVELRRGGVLWQPLQGPRRELGLSAMRCMAATAHPRGVMLSLSGSRHISAHLLNRRYDIVEPRRLPEPMESRAMALASTWVAVVGKYDKGLGLIRTFDLETYKTLGQREVLTTCISAAVHPQAKKFAVGTRGGAVLVCDVDDPQRGFELKTQEAGGFRVRGHSGPVVGVAFSPDGSRLYSVSGNKTRSPPNQLKMWDLKTRTPGRAIPLQGYPHSLAISPDGRLLAIGTRRGTAEVWMAD